MTETLVASQALDGASPARSPKTRPKCSTTLTRASGLQDLIWKDAQAAKGSALGQLCKSFVSLEQLKLRIKMKPAPKPIDVVDPRKSKAKQPRSSFSEGPEPGKANVKDTQGQANVSVSPDKAKD